MRHHVVCPALLGLMLVWSTPARAAKPAPEIHPIDPSQVRTIGVETRRTTGAGSCTIGAQGPPVFAVNYLLPPNDSYYTLLRCEQCPPPDSTSFADVHVAMRFPSPCAQPIEISVVGAAGDTSCCEPDTLAILSAPEPFALSAASAGDYDFVLHLSHPALFAGEAFLRVNFTVAAEACSSLAERPQLLTNSDCAPCRSWNVSAAGKQDLCAVLFPGQPVMYAIASTCLVPVRARSWGAVKLRYR